MNSQREWQTAVYSVILNLIQDPRFGNGEVDTTGAILSCPHGVDVASSVA